MCPKNYYRIMILLSMLASMSLKADETIKMEGMSVIGNKESPNLLYIVPWKSPKMPDMEEPLISSRIFGEALEPVTREVLIREELYRDARRQIFNR